jgi:hypothetical protein
MKNQAVWSLLLTRVLAWPSLAGELDRRIEALPVIDEIDTAAVPPVHEFPVGGSRTCEILGRAARAMEPADTPKVMGWLIGRGKGLKPGAAYVVEIDYPDDVPRAIFVANRGADLVRGFATGSATGDARQQYTQPSLESLAYPQSGRWQTYRTAFVLHERFQGLYAQRDPRPGGRPFGPADGFHVLVFQTKQLNDPRSQGAAVGTIRLRAVSDLSALYARPELPPADLPRRRVFYREEMADEVVQGREAHDRGVTDPVDWLVAKAKLCRVLAINTFAKDLLEFGFNQGWESGDPSWVMNAQPPLVDGWNRLVPRVAALGLDLLPYYEYKGAIGMQSAKPVSLGWQRRAEKLYHTAENPRYTAVWWTEAHNADLTGPDTLADAKRLLDRTIVDFKARAHFAGVWFRVRDNHLPMSFSEAAVGRFRVECGGDPLARGATRATLMASYEGDRRLYDRYVEWWLGRRARFFRELQQYLVHGLGDARVRIWFTPWTSEPIPMLRDPASGRSGHPVQVTTDDPAWWDAYARRQPDSSWWRWALVPKSYDAVVAGNDYGLSLAFREPFGPTPGREEPYHSAPNGDPDRYRDLPGVILTFPAGRLFTVARPDLLDRFRAHDGLALVRHYPLNEDDHDRTRGPSGLPFDGQLGYIAVDVDRAGPYVRLLEARAVAAGDPWYLGALCASSYSSGFPDAVRRFNEAFLAVPALPSVVKIGAASDAAVVVREVPTARHGTYYYVINTAMQPNRGVTVHLASRGALRDLVAHTPVVAQGGALRLDLEPGELRSFRAGPGRGDQ